jgi:hypothetical protein
MGSGVDVYVLDSGVMRTNTWFGKDQVVNFRGQSNSPYQKISSMVRRHFSVLTAMGPSDYCNCCFLLQDDEASHGTHVNLIFLILREIYFFNAHIGCRNHHKCRASSTNHQREGA